MSGIATGYERSVNGGYYKSHMYGVSFNVNDDLSISYGYHDSRKEDLSNSSSYHHEDMRYVEAQSWQIAYTVGGASLRFAETKAKNIGYATGNANDRSASTISVGLAF